MTSKIHKPFLRRCISAPCRDSPELFPKVEKGFYTFPYNTYWVSVPWTVCKNDILNAFSVTKTQLDQNIDKENKIMKKFCDDNNDTWLDKEKNNLWSIKTMGKNGEIRINVQSDGRKTELGLKPFLDNGRLAVEIHRWKGCGLLLNTWLKYVLKFTSNELHRR